MPAVLMRNFEANKRDHGMETVMVVRAGMDAPSAEILYLERTIGSYPNPCVGPIFGGNVAVGEGRGAQIELRKTRWRKTAPLEEVASSLIRDPFRVHAN